MAEEFENTSQDTQADVKGAGTMLAAPFEIARQDTLEAVQLTVNETKTTIGNIDDPAGEDTMVGLIKSIPETVPTGAVKSVQFGTGKIADGNYTEIKTANITINTVNPQKCIVLIYTSVSSGYDRSYGMGCYVESLTSNQLTIKVGVLMTYSWQVIEFY